MKFSFFKNDKETMRDELILTAITLGCLVSGLLLVIFKPSFWIVSSTNFVVLGVLLLMLAFMYAPCVIYRFMTNNKKEEV